MFCISLQSDDPFFNLAVEEILFKKSGDDFFILGINSTSLIIGKHQSAHREADTKYVSEHNIPVIRRITGGGTVFHDRGNLFYTFITNSEQGKQVDFRKYTQPVVDYLQTLAIDARFEGMNDIKVGGFKISGNAEHVYRDRVLHHGTLLYSSSLNMLRNALRKDTSCYSTKAVVSNPSPVMNLSEMLIGFNDIYQFRSEMMEHFITLFPLTLKYNLSAKEVDDASSLALSKYMTWEWNYAYGPEYQFKNTVLIKDLNHSVIMYVKDGIIRECTIEGSNEMKHTGNKLIGCRHMPEDMLKVFYEEGIKLTDEAIYSFF